MGIKSSSQWHKRSLLRTLTRSSKKIKEGLVKWGRIIFIDIRRRSRRCITGTISRNWSQRRHLVCCFPFQNTSWVQRKEIQGFLVTVAEVTIQDSLLHGFVCQRAIADHVWHVCGHKYLRWASPKTYWYKHLWMWGIKTIFTLRLRYTIWRAQAWKPKTPSITKLM